MEQRISEELQSLLGRGHNVDHRVEGGARGTPAAGARIHAFLSYPAYASGASGLVFPSHRLDGGAIGPNRRSVYSSNSILSLQARRCSRSSRSRTKSKSGFRGARGLYITRSGNGFVTSPTEAKRRSSGCSRNDQRKSAAFSAICLPPLQPKPRARDSVHHAIAPRPGAGRSCPPGAPPIRRTYNPASVPARGTTYHRPKPPISRNLRREQARPSKMRRLLWRRALPPHPAAPSHTILMSLTA